MHGRPLRTVLLMALVLVLAGLAKAQQKPFTLEQVQGLVRDGIGDETGAKLITQRGIDFAPAEDFLQTLKAAGANDAFLQALRTAKPPQAEGAGATKPLTQIQVLSLVSGEVPNHRVATLVQERGIDFEPGNVFFTELRLAGGDDELINALKNANVTKSESIDQALLTRQTEVREHTARGAELLKKKQYADAEAEYRAAIQLDPQNADLHNSLGITLGRKGDWDGQIAEEREALRLNPNNDRAHVGLGVALSQKDDQEGAMAEYREALRLNPNNDQAHINLGNRLSHKKDWDGAIAEYREAIRLNPNNDVAHLSLGVALSQKDDQDGAITEYREAIRLNPSNEQAHINLGNRLSHKDDWNGAIAEYGEAVRLNSGNHAAHYNLGMAYEHQGNRQAALQEYRTAYELSPKNATYQKAFERLNTPGSL